MLIIEHMIFELQTNAQKGKKMEENEIDNFQVFIFLYIYVHIY